MSSNSKLTQVQKADRKAMLDNLPYGATLAMSLSGVTFLVVPAGAVDWVYSSVASLDETKIRRKVGEYHALMRWAHACNGFALPAGLVDAYQLANMPEFKDS